MAILSRTELEALGFRKIGQGLRVSDKASFYGAERIEIGDRTRIDDYCVLSAGAGGIFIGRHVHIACYTSLLGAGPIRLEDFSNLSTRVSVFSSSDDFSGETMTNPTVSDEWKSVMHAPVTVGRHVVVGSGSVILPGVELGEGCAVGALSLIKQDCLPFTIYGGVPARALKERSRRLIELEKGFEP